MALTPWQAQKQGVLNKAGAEPIPTDPEPAPEVEVVTKKKKRKVAKKKR